MKYFLRSEYHQILALVLCYTVYRYNYQMHENQIIFFYIIKYFVAKIFYLIYGYMFSKMYCFETI